MMMAATFENIALMRIEKQLQMAQKLSAVEIVDKLHMTGHIDRWCKENYDPYKFKDLEKVMNSINHILLSIEQ